MEYYMDAMEHHGLKGHLPQPENFTTCGKLGIEINQYNCPIEVWLFYFIYDLQFSRRVLTKAHDM